MKRLLVVSLAVALGGCSDDATEIVALVDGDLTIPGEATALRVEITEPGGAIHIVDGDLTEQGFPRTVGIVWEGGELGPVVLRAVAQHDRTDVVSRRARTAFKPGRVVVVRLDLVRACQGVGCTGDQTCAAGVCRSIDVADDELETWNGTPHTRFTDGSVPPPVDGGPPPDAGPRPDAGPPPPDAGPRPDAGCTPSPEVCNMRDDNCDGRVDETFDLATDENNCGRCGTVCRTSTRVCCAGMCQHDPCM